MRNYRAGVARSRGPVHNGGAGSLALYYATSTSPSRCSSFPSPACSGPLRARLQSSRLVRCSLHVTQTVELTLPPQHSHHSRNRACHQTAARSHLFRQAISGQFLHEAEMRDFSCLTKPPSHDRCIRRTELASRSCRLEPATETYTSSRLRPELCFASHTTIRQSSSTRGRTTERGCISRRDGTTYRA